MPTLNRTPVVLKVEVKRSMSVINTKSSLSKTLTEVDKSYQATVWTQIFPDGSAKNDTSNRGSIDIRQPNKPPITIVTAGGSIFSSYKAEAQTLLIVTETAT